MKEIRNATASAYAMTHRIQDRRPAFVSQPCVFTEQGTRDDRLPSCKFQLTRLSAARLSCARP